MILAAGTNLSDTGRLSPAVAYWTPNAVMTAWAIFLVIKKSREIDFKIVAAIRNAVRRFGSGKIG
jgi:hypothetical protein